MDKRNPQDVNLAGKISRRKNDSSLPAVSDGVKPIIFGIVRSRRLGKSLGINIVPPKTCSLNCVYCQIGRTRKTSQKRQPYVSPEEVEKQVKRFLTKSKEHPDYLTLSGAGEPTLNSQIGKIIRRIKKAKNLPVAVITNATLLSQAAVRRQLKAADIVLPSLDAARQKTFERINRPCPGIKINEMIRGLRIFRKIYKGTIWLEIMLVRNVNDSKEDLRALKKVVSFLKPDRVQLNTVVRDPAEKFAKPLGTTELKRIKKFFGKSCEIISGRKDKRKTILKELTQKNHTA